MRSRLLTDVDGSWYFTGDLTAAIRIAKVNRFVKITVHNNMWRVELCDDPALTEVAEWGSSPTSMDEAWRFALGALLGPPDDSHDERLLWTMLQIYADPNPASSPSKETAQ